MTHLQILSNSENKYGEKNYTNLFTMKLGQPIDAENEKKFVEVLAVNYPKTTKNIYDDRCFFNFKIYFLNFANVNVIHNTTHRHAPIQVMYHSPIYDIPQDLYDINELIGYFNSYCSNYDIELRKLNNNRVVLCVGFNGRYKYRQQENPGVTGKGYDGQPLNEWNYGDVITPGLLNSLYYSDGDVVGGMIVEVYFSKNLTLCLETLKMQ